VRKLSLIN